MNDMNLLYNKFLSFEKQHNLLSADNNFCFIWERIRFEVYRLLQEVKLDFGRAHTSENKSNLSSVNRIKIFFVFFFNSIMKNPFLFPNEYQYIFWSGGRRIWDPLKKKFLNINIDYLIDNLSRKKTLLIEEPTINRHYRPTYTKNICYGDFFLLLRSLRRRFFKNRKDELIIYNYYSKIENDFKMYFDENISIAKNALNTFRMYNADMPILNFFFKKHIPKIFFVICSYGNENIIEAAKSNNIPVVEIQHGLIAKGDTAAYDILDGFIKRSFPDYFFSYGKFWLKDINFPIHQKKMYNVGFPYLVEQSKLYKNVFPKDQIIFISQGIYGKKIAGIAIELLKMIPDNIKIIFKLHPGEWDRWKNTYPELFIYNRNNRIKVIDDNLTIHNYQLLAESKWVCGVNSTLIYESLFFRCNIFIIDLPGCEVMSSLIKNGIAFLINNANDIFTKLNSQEFNSIRYINQSILNDYFVINWKGEFEKAIQDVINNKDHPYGENYKPRLLY
jgi:hypothetical protein